MAEYHVGCGAFGIYAGTLNKDKSMWRNKSDVTNEAFLAVATYCVDNNVSREFNYHGKKYRLEVKESEDDDK